MQHNINNLTLNTNLH